MLQALNAAIFSRVVYLGKENGEERDLYGQKFKLCEHKR